MFRYAEGRRRWHPAPRRDISHTALFVCDATWAALSERYTTQQLMDVVFTVGQYNMMSMALNSFRVQLDDGVAGF